MDAVICVFVSVVPYPSLEIATFSMTYVDDSSVFIGEFIHTRPSGDSSYSFTVAKSVPSIYYGHHILLYIFWILSLAFPLEVCQSGNKGALFGVPQAFLLRIQVGLNERRDVCPAMRTRGRYRLSFL